MDTPEQELDKVTAAINRLARGNNGRSVYKAGGLFKRARELAEEDDNFSLPYDNVSHYVTICTPQWSRQTAYECMYLHDRFEDSPYEQHLDRIERSGAINLSRKKVIPPDLFEEIMVDVVEILEDPLAFANTDTIAELIKRHKRKDDDNDDDNDNDDNDEDDDDNKEDPPPDRTITATTWAQFINAIIWSIEGGDEMQFTPDTLFELTNEVSGVVDIPCLKKEHITKFRKLAALSKKYLELIEDATTD